MKKIRIENVLHLGEFALGLPGTSANAERIYSELKILWSTEKSQLKVSTISNLLTIKCDFDEDCRQFYEKIKNSKTMLKKYILQKITQIWH
jgi:hypothetical protein